MRRRHILAAGVAVALSGTPAGAQTLAEAVAEAYRTNPSLGASRYDVRQSDEGVAQARAELRPTADIQIVRSYDRSVAGVSSRNPLSPAVTDSNTDQAQLSLLQPLYTSGRATADRRGAEAGVGAAREALRGVEGDLLLAVTTAYLDVRRYTAQLAVWQASVGQLELLEKEIVARREAGELTLTDVAQARNQLGQEREQALATREQLEAARADFADLVGREPGDLPAEPELPRVPRDADEAFLDAERNSPELARAVFIERGSRAAIDSARASGGASVSLRGTAALSGRFDPYSLRDQNRDLGASVVLSLPLSAGGRIASQIRQAEDRNGQDRLRIEGARRDLMRDVRNAWNAMATSRRARDLIDTRRAAAAIQLDGMLAEYRVGLRSTFDVLYAQQSLRDAELSVLGARRDSYIAAATLLRRTGALEVRTLASGIPRIDPAVHLHEVEGRGARPWDGAIRAIDSVWGARRRVPAIELPPPAAHPAILPARAGPAGDLPFAGASPDTPLLGTAGISRGDGR